MTLKMILIALVVVVAVTAFGACIARAMRELDDGDANLGLALLILGAFGIISSVTTGGLVASSLIDQAYPLVEGAGV